MIRPFYDFMLCEHALPPGDAVKGDHSAHWKSLFGFLEANLKAQGMKHCLEPTATQEEFRTHCENGKIVLQDCASCYFKRHSVKSALKRTVSTRAQVTSWGQINKKGASSDKQKNRPRSAGNQERREVFTRKKRPLKENAKCKDRQEKRAWKMASLVSEIGWKAERRGGSDHNFEAFEKAFSHITDKEIAKADASRHKGPAPFDSGDRLQGVVHGPN